MKDERLPARLSLIYELEPGDLQDMQVVSARRRQRQVHALVTAVPLAALSITFIVLTGALSHASLMRGAPAWLYAADMISCALLAVRLRAALRLTPERLARAIWRANPGYRGRHHEELDERGVTWTAPTGSQIFVPWSVVAGVRETERAFHLLDASGIVRSSLPKHGLASPDLVPVLREVLNRSAGSRPSAVTAV
jgi:hypothetical protein